MEVEKFVQNIDIHLQYSKISQHSVLQFKWVTLVSAEFPVSAHIFFY
jgi:hypothetical protein